MGEDGEEASNCALEEGKAEEEDEDDDPGRVPKDGHDFWRKYSAFEKDVVKYVEFRALLFRGGEDDSGRRGCDDEEELSSS